MKLAAKPDGIDIEIFSTAPQSAHYDGGFADRLVEIARWSEAAGCTGILIYSDNSLVDPWLAAQLVISHTHSLSPLVALQPVYLHPFAAAKMVTSLAYIYRRRLSLNLIAGGFRNDLVALCDQTPHDQRYARLTEYMHIVRGLLSQTQPFSYRGRYYHVSNLVLRPLLPPELLPRVLISGSSDVGRQAARDLEAVAVEYPEPGAELRYRPSMAGSGIRIGIITADCVDEAWRRAYARFPEDRTGHLKHKLAMKVSDSHWHRQLSAIATEEESGTSIYWLGPFKNYNTFCPYLVGSREQISDEIAKYLRVGFRTIILDIPLVERDLFDATEVIRSAAAKAVPRYDWEAAQA